MEFKLDLLQAPVTDLDDFWTISFWNKGSLDVDQDNDSDVDQHGKHNDAFVRTQNSQATRFRKNNNLIRVRTKKNLIFHSGKEWCLILYGSSNIQYHPRWTADDALSSII